jgi:hypothetical protein
MPLNNMILVIEFNNIDYCKIHIYYKTHSKVLSNPRFFKIEKFKSGLRQNKIPIFFDDLFFS